MFRFVDEVQRTNERLSVFPRLGKIEPALRGLKREYRSLVVHKNYKVIYYIDDDMANENKMVTKAIENAQKRVEGQN